MRIRTMFSIRNTSFLQQLILLFVLGIFCLSLLSSAAIYSLSYRIVRDRWVAQGLRGTQTFADQATLALLYFSAENAEAPVSSIMAFPDVRGVAIYGADHKLLLSRGETPTEQREWPQNLAMERETDRAWYFASPVFASSAPIEEASPFVAEPQKPQLIGFVRLVMSKDTLGAMQKGILWINVAVSGGFGLLFLLLLLAITRRLTTPLNRLAAIMGQASAGEKGVRAEIGGPRDIVEMELAFNTMMGVIQAREEALHLQTVELEEEVAERQMAQENLQEKALLLEEEIEKRQEVQEELERLNESLEQRVQERTAELEDKNSELYRMNRLFVGRELRMVELKEKIKELEKAAN